MDLTMAIDREVGAAGSKRRGAHLRRGRQAYDIPVKPAQLVRLLAGDIDDEVLDVHCSSS